MADAAAAFPRPGLLSNMVVTWATALAVLVGGFTSPVVQDTFARPMTDDLIEAFAVSWLLMLLHKVESFVMGEFDHCPIYLAAAVSTWSANVRSGLFVTFVASMQVFTLLIVLIMHGEPWPLLLIAVWAAQGLHEVHHSAKSVAMGGYYPGTWSSLLFIGWSAGFLVPAWLRAWSAPVWALAAYVVAIAVLFVAYWAEHRIWLAKVEVVGGLDVVRSWRDRRASA